MTKHWTDRLSEYLDDELDAATRAEVDRHLAECVDCSTTLAELERVVMQARTLPDAMPATDLWTGIAGRIAAESDNAGAPVLDLQRFAEKKQRTRISFSVPQLVAAGIVLMLVSGGTVWLTLSGARQSGTAVLPAMTAQVSPEQSTQAVRTAGSTDTVAPAAPEPTGGSAAEPAQRFAAAPSTQRSAGAVVNAAARPLPAERPYDTAVSDLQSVLAEGRTKLDPKTVRILEDNLRVIDRAIEDARSALARDPANVYLNEHLARNMQRKLELLRRASAIVSGQS